MVTQSRVRCVRFRLRRTISRLFRDDSDQTSRYGEQNSTVSLGLSRASDADSTGGFDLLLVCTRESGSELRKDVAFTAAARLIVDV